MKRVVVIGAGGFIGSAVTHALNTLGHDVVKISRSEIDLQAKDADRRVYEVLKPDDYVVFAAASAPCKSVSQFEDNIAMFGAFLRGIESRGVAHICYISSDAVYCDTALKIDEQSPTCPTTLHGLMHITRESLLGLASESTLILRPTLVFGADDPHNGYGPNRYLRLAKNGGEIVLFGDGEERRDHIHISDLASAAGLLISGGHRGTWNLATGMVHSFRELAEAAVRLGSQRTAIVSSPRNGPMPHLGLREFDISRLRNTLPKFQPVSAIQRMMEDYPNYGN